MLVGLALTTACGGLVEPGALTGTPVVTATATPTIVWFPPTRTPTPLLLPTPTSEISPTLSGLIFREDFERPTLWTAILPPAAQAVFESNRLILSLDREQLYGLLLRTEPVVTDFYAQVVVRLNLCRQKDAYGLLFRAASAGDYYRYILNCQGQVRLERARGGQITPLNEWQTSGDVPPGALGEVKLGVWAVGADMRFFLNDHFQFAVRDTLFRSGQVGLFALSASETSLVVVFSDLEVYEPAADVLPVHTPAGP